MKTLALMVILGLMTLLPAGVLAQQSVQPHVFFGTAFLLDGSVAPDGTVVSAIVNNAVVAASVVPGSGEPGSYVLTVPPPLGGANLPVSFTIDGNPVAESAVWRRGGFDELNLTETPGVFGDINGDQKVNIIDLAILGSVWGLRAGSAGFNVGADLDDSGTIDSADLNILAGIYGTGN